MHAKKIFYTALTLVLLVTAFVITGVLAPEEYTGEINEQFSDTQKDMWRNLTSLEARKGRKPDVERISVIEEDRDGILWTEYLKNGKRRTLRLIEREIPNYFVIEIIQADNGFTGRWEYYLSQDEGIQKTNIKIKEKSYNTNLLLRAWHTVLGRSINLRREVKSLRVSLFQRLLRTP